jgi:predicted glycogen debranching enzyme
MNLPALNLNREALSHLDEALQKEWIITNGLGGYASSTVLGLNTRKYHGLLISAFHPPGDRRVCLTKLDEELVMGSSTCPLGGNEFQSGIFPKGYLSLKEFSLMPFPRFVYETQDVEVQKTVFMPHGKNVVIALYKVLNRGNADAKIRVFPLVNWRPFHSVTNRWKTATDVTHDEEARKVEIRSNNPRSTLILAVTNGSYEFADKWVERLCLREEVARGESCLDDCFQPGFFEVSVRAKRNESFAIAAVADQDERVARQTMNEMPVTLYDMGGLFEKESERWEGFLARFYGERGSVVTSDWLSWLVSATDAFVVRGSGVGQRSVIAGYYWFEAWGRDTFVSLPGLLLVTGRFEEARQVFLNFKSHCKQGLIPNFIPETDGEPVYNSVDATLWFVNAVLQYLKYTGDFRFVQEKLWETLKAIVSDLAKGTLFGIRVDADGLLVHGGQLTWMDAVVDGQPVTPRDGKAIEVQALWFNMLKTVELLANRFGETSEAAMYAGMAERAKKSFVEEFWNADRGCLFDVVSDGFRDGSLRPNQVMAVALDFAMLDSAKNENIVDVVQRELLTPCGLRTLARGDSRYVGVYFGDRGRRDLAYHNGTVWPWLLGPFTTAFLKAKGYMAFRREYAFKNILSPLLTRQVFEAGLGFVSEIFDGEPPHTARGCVAQAWSVAEPLRAYVEDVVNARPQHEREVLGLVY